MIHLRNHYQNKTTAFSTCEIVLGDRTLKIEAQIIRQLVDTALGQPERFTPSRVVSVTISDESGNSMPLDIGGVRALAEFFDGLLYPNGHNR